MLKFHTDSGHGWLAVKRAELETLGIIDLVSQYSYHKGATVYLEEDCDAGLFFSAFEVRYGTRPQFETKYKDGNSPIRNYARMPKPAHDVDFGKKYELATKKEAMREYLESNV